MDPALFCKIVLILQEAGSEAFRLFRHTFGDAPFSRRNARQKPVPQGGKSGTETLTKGVLRLRERVLVISGVDHREEKPAGGQDPSTFLSGSNQ